MENELKKLEQEKELAQKAWSNASDEASARYIANLLADIQTKINTLKAKLKGHKWKKLLLSHSY